MSDPKIIADEREEPRGAAGGLARAIGRWVAGTWRDWNAWLLMSPNERPPVPWPVFAVPVGVIVMFLLIAWMFWPSRRAVAPPAVALPRATVYPRSFVQWKDDCFDSFRAMVVSNAPMPQQAMLAGTRWNKTDEVSGLRNADGEFSATIYECELEDHRLLVFCDPSKKVPVLIAEEVNVDGDWALHGWMMLAVGPESNRLFGFSRTDRGKAVEQMGEYRWRKRRGTD